MSRLFVSACCLTIVGTAMASGEESANMANMKGVSFTAACDGTTQRYVLVFPEGFEPERPHDLLIALHGHGSDRWQFPKDPRDECRAVRNAAAEHGMILVSPDYRAKTSWMGPKAEADVVQIIQNLKEQYRVDKVILCGGSMGGASCLTFIEKVCGTPEKQSRP